MPLLSITEEVEEGSMGDVVTPIAKATIPPIPKATTLKDIEVEVVEAEVEETPMAQVTNLNANDVANLDI